MHPIAHRPRLYLFSKTMSARRRANWGAQRKSVVLLAPIKLKFMIVKQSIMNRTVRVRLLNYQSYLALQLCHDAKQ